MPAITARAPGKVILFGEHAVIYGRPAIAVPVTQIQAKATLLGAPFALAGQVWIYAPDVNLQSDLYQLPESHSFRILFQLIMQELNISRLPALRLRINSSIPVAAGLGSGAAVSVAALRAISSFVGHPLNDERVCALAYQVEKVYHGTPSGIDNTVIAYARPIYFVKGQPFELLRVSQPFTLVIADSGVKSPTLAAVGGVRTRWQTDPAAFDSLFDQTAAIAREARLMIEKGLPDQLGPLMDENHKILQQIGVSCPELDHLVASARQAGALGAKLSGAGQGGNIIALTNQDKAVDVARALEQTGATRTIITSVASSNG
ncbi:MAG TPA: mevalonate kinase [Anaerolineaceae bacterium]|jgi:mevalonate kinase